MTGVHVSAACPLSLVPSLEPSADKLGRGSLCGSVLFSDAFRGSFLPGLLHPAAHSHPARKPAPLCFVPGLRKGDLGALFRNLLVTPPDGFDSSFSRSMLSIVGGHGEVRWYMKSNRGSKRVQVTYNFSADDLLGY